MAFPGDDAGRLGRIQNELCRNVFEALDHAAYPLSIPDAPMGRNALVENVEANYASAFHDHLARQIIEFDQALDDQFEVGVRLVTFGQSIVFHLEELGYEDPSLITFGGITEDGAPVRLIQHVSQISILLMKLRRQDPTQPKQPIGFHVRPDGESPSLDGT